MSKYCFRCGFENRTLFPLPEWPDHCLFCVEILNGRCIRADCESGLGPHQLFQEPRCNKECLVCETCLKEPLTVHGHGATDCEADGCVTPEEVAYDYYLLLQRRPDHHVPYWDNRIKHL